MKDEGWNLKYVNSQKFVHKKKILQPGEPTYSIFEFDHLRDDTPFHFNLSARKSNIQSIKMELDNYKSIEIPIEIKEGQILAYKGGKTGILYSKNWENLGEVELDLKDIVISKGAHTIHFDCSFSGGDESQAALELRLFEKKELIQVKH
jgi:hypothetical protein